MTLTPTLSRRERGHNAPGTIIIFGAAVRPDGTPSGALRDRVDAAIRFGRTRPGVLYMPTGGQGRFGAPEADVMADLLRAQGIDRIEPERTARNTIGSVRACVRLLRGRPGPVFAATSGYHLPRCVLLLRLAGLDAHACPPPPRHAATRWTRRWFWRLREVPALPLDAALMLWDRTWRR